MFRVLLTAVVVTVVVPRLADACSCVERSSCQLFASAGAVFVADVIEVTEGATGPKRSRMRVLRAYKGTAKAGDEVTVTMPRGSSASCSLDVDAGDRFVIHAGAGADGYSTSLCQGSYGLKKDDPLPDLPPPGGVVTGTLVRFSRDGSSFEPQPIAGAPLWIITPDGRIESKTDGKGTFRLSGVPPGPWTVRFDVGPTERAEAPVMLHSPQDCAEVYTSPRPAGRLIGSVFDAAGKPVVGAAVSVEPVEPTPGVHGRSGQPGPSGAFIVSGLAAGTYHVIAGGSDAPTVKFPHQRTFHPGVADQASAVPVAIGTETVYLPATRVPAPAAVVEIAGEIVCRDGTRPASASISAQRLPAANEYSGKEFSSETPTDGRYTVSVLRGHRYAVRGAVTVKEPGPEGHFYFRPVHTPAVEVDPDAPPPQLVLRLELEKCAEPGGVTVPARRR